MFYCQQTACSSSRLIRQPPDEVLVGGRVVVRELARSLKLIQSCRGKVRAATSARIELEPLHGAVIRASRSPMYTFSKDFSGSKSGL
jgi:hypothetical protein